jgi:hypothetical protein
MSKFIEVTFNGTNVLLNTSNITEVYWTSGGGCSIYFGDGECIKPQETYEEVRKMIYG